MAGFFIAIVGALHIAAGVLLYVSAPTNGLLAALVFGMGVMIFALGVACVHLASIRDALEKISRAPAPPS